MHTELFCIIRVYFFNFLINQRRLSGSLQNPSLMIRFEQVSKAYPGGHHALKNLSFNIGKGEMIFIAGHSGAGKSTVLKLISGIIKPSGGKVWLNKQDLGTLNDNQLGFLRQHIGIVFQDH